MKVGEFVELPGLTTMIFGRRSPKRTPREVHLCPFTPRFFLAQLLQVEYVRKVESQKNNPFNPRILFVGLRVQ